MLPLFDPNYYVIIDTGLFCLIWFVLLSCLNKDSNKEQQQEISATVCVFTQNGHDDVVLQDLDGTPRQEVEGRDDVAAVHQRVTGRRVCGSEVHGQGPQAAFGGSLERFAVVENVPVEVEADICLQALGETF